mmetsp:Transcript_8856/g.26622  ORF Transcript_8856/g.26622 Transcript_8856/m.26622 type:complete len:186 (+) Transcript_8856:172-729(+)
MLIRAASRRVLSPAGPAKVRSFAAAADAPLSLNIDKIVDKAFEGTSLRQLKSAPISALQGLADWTDEVGAEVGLASVGKLGEDKYIKWAAALVELAKYEIPEHRVAGSRLNVNKALDMAHEGKTLKEILALPPSALQGLSPKADDAYAKLKIKTIEDLGTWKYAAAARGICVLADVEAASVDEHK